MHTKKLENKGEHSAQAALQTKTIRVGGRQTEVPQSNYIFIYDKLAHHQDALQM